MLSSVFFEYAPIIYGGDGGAILFSLCLLTCATLTPVPVSAILPGASVGGSVPVGPFVIHL